MNHNPMIKKVPPVPEKSYPDHPDQTQGNCKTSEKSEISKAKTESPKPNTTMPYAS